MKRLEQIIAIIVLLLAVVIVLSTGELTIWDDFAPGSRFMAIIVAGASAVLALLLFREAKHRSTEDQVGWPEGRDRLRVMLLGVAVVAFVSMAAWTGFVVSVFAFVAITLYLILRRPLFPSLVAATITAGLIYSVFIAWLGIRLPTIFGF